MQRAIAVLKVLRDVDAWKQGARTAVAGLSTYLLAQYFELPQGYWSVITAIMIVQETMGATLQAARDRLIGTIAGAVIGFLLAAVTPSGILGSTIGLTISIGWLAVFATRYPSLRIAPLTAAIMFVATPSHADAIVSAAHRVEEILLGCVVAIAVQLLVFPKRARTLLRAEVARVLALTADVITHAEDNPSSIELNKKLEAAYGEMNKLAKQVQAEHFGNSPASGLDPDNVNHALRHLRIAVFGLRRVTRRVSSEGNSAIADGVSTVNRSIQAYLLQLSLEISEQGTIADPEPMDRALAQLSSDASQSHKSVTPSAEWQKKMVSFYKDAYEQTRMAANELRDAVFGTAKESGS